MQHIHSIECSRRRCKMLQRFNRQPQTNPHNVVPERNGTEFMQRGPIFSMQEETGVPGHFKNMLRETSCQLKMGAVKLGHSYTRLKNCCPFSMMELTGLGVLLVFNQILPVIEFNYFVKTYLKVCLFSVFGISWFDQKQVLLDI